MVDRPKGSSNNRLHEWAQKIAGSVVSVAITAPPSGGDANYTIQPTDTVIWLTSVLTAPRTWTLPPASSVPPNHQIIIFDMAGGVTLTNTLTVQRAGADTIVNGATSVTLNSIVTGFCFTSDGVSRWEEDLLIAGASNLLNRFSVTQGSILYQAGGTSWQALAPGTSGQFLKTQGAAANPVWDTVTQVAAATQAEQEAASSTTVYTSPGRQQFHPGSLKAWARFNTAGSIAAAFNISSVTDNGAGDWTPNFGTSFSSGNYNFVGTTAALKAGGTDFWTVVQDGDNAPATGSCRVTTWSTAGINVTDPNVGRIWVEFAGDQ